MSIAFQSYLRSNDSILRKSGALQEGLAALFRRPDIIVEGEHAISRDTTVDSTPEEDS